MWNNGYLFRTIWYCYGTLGYCEKPCIEPSFIEYNERRNLKLYLFLKDILKSQHFIPILQTHLFYSAIHLFYSIYFIYFYSFILLFIMPSKLYDFAVWPINRACNTQSNCAILYSSADDRVCISCMCVYMYANVNGKRG